MGKKFKETIAKENFIIVGFVFVCFFTSSHNIIHILESRFPVQEDLNSLWMSFCTYSVDFVGSEDIITEYINIPTIFKITFLAFYQPA